MPQIIPIVVAVGAKVIGASVLVSTLAVAAATVGPSLLSSKGSPAPAATKINPEPIERLNASIDPRTPRKTVVGTTAFATDIRDQEYTNDQAYLHRFVVCASHRVRGYREIWFDDVLAWTSTGGVQGKFVGYLDVTPVTEGSAGNAINISARMGATRRFTGLAYVYFRYKLTGNAQQNDSPFAQSIPSRITIVGDGAYLYDPRRDSTVPGGSGPQRINDQSTWEWSDDACRNPALELLFYLIGYRINGKLAVGCGVPPARLLLQKFITAANMCDEPVTKAAGGTEPRYRCDGIWSEGIGRRAVMAQIKDTMNAELDDFGGGLGLTILHNDLSMPVASFTADDVIDAGEWTGGVDLDQGFNVVRGTFTDASDNSLYQQPDYPQVELASVDGIERADTFNLPFVESPSQAQRLAKMRLQRQQYGGTIPMTLQITGWRVQKNDPIRLTFPALGWVNKPFRVAEIENRLDGKVPVLLRDENVALYQWDAEEAPAVQAAAPTTYDQGLNPIIQSIDEKTRNVVYTASAKGLNVTPPAGFALGLRDAVGNAFIDPNIGIDSAIGARSYVVCWPSNASRTVWNTRGFDVYGNGAVTYPPPFGGGAADMASLLNSIADGTPVVVYTYDEPAANRLTGGLPAAMYRCGASSAVFGGTFRTRSAYVLIGKAGWGEGRGFEQYAGAVDNDPLAFVETGFQIINDVPVGFMKGRDGANAILIYLTSTEQTFKYDQSNSPIAQTTKFTARRQNTTGQTLYTVSWAGGGPYGPANAADLAAWGSANRYFTRIDDDNFTMTQAQFQQFASDSGATAFTIKAYPTGLPTIVDYVSVTKVKDGTAGPSGTDGFSVSTEIAFFGINVLPSGAAKPSWTGGSGTIRLIKGGARITSGVSYSVVNDGNVTGLSLSGDTFSFTDIATDSAIFTINAVYAGVTYSAKVAVKRIYDGSPAFEASDDIGISSQVVTSTAVNMGGFNTTIPGGRTVRLSAAVGYSGPDFPPPPPGYLSWTGRIYLYAQNISAGGSAVLLGSSTNGTLASFERRGTPSEPEGSVMINGSASASFDFTSASVDSLYQFWVTIVAVSGNSSGPVTAGGTLTSEVIA